MSKFYCSLEQDALLHITGPDTLTFLQGQTTCDTRTVDQQHAVPGAYCTPQGRVVCDFLLCQLGADHFALRMRRDIRVPSSAVFGKYIIFSKATLEAERDDWRPIALWGREVAADLRDIFGDIPGAAFETSSGEGFLLVQTDVAGEQFECYLNTDNTDLLTRLNEKLKRADESVWHARQIAAGIARIEVATVGDFVPQILNYDLTDHINFTKGCYTGQEVVARLHYRGKPKRRTYVAQFSGSKLATAGTPVFSAAQTQSIGNVINSAATSDDTVVLLVAATTEGVANGLHLGAPDGPLLLVGELPYPLSVPDSVD